MYFATGVHTDESKIVLFLGAANHPWKLDDAILRRLQKRIYVGLPSGASSVRVRFLKETPFSISLNKLCTFVCLPHYHNLCCSNCKVFFI